MPNQTKTSKSWLNVWWILTTLAIGLLLGMAKQPFYVAALMIIIGLVIIVLWKKDRIKRGFELLVYLLLLFVGGYSGQMIGVLIHFAWILIALLIFLFMVYWNLRKGNFQRRQSQKDKAA